MSFSTTEDSGTEKLLLLDHQISKLVLQVVQVSIVLPLWRFRSPIYFKKHVSMGFPHNIHTYIKSEHAPNGCTFLTLLPEHEAWSTASLVTGHDFNDPRSCIILQSCIVLSPLTFYATSTSPTTGYTVHACTYIYIYILYTDRHKQTKR